VRWWVDSLIEPAELQELTMYTDVLCDLLTPTASIDILRRTSRARHEIIDRFNSQVLECT